MSVSKQSSYEKPFKMSAQILAAKASQKLISNSESQKNVSEQKLICLPVTRSITCSFKWLGSKKTPWCHCTLYDSSCYFFCEMTHKVHLDPLFQSIFPCSGTCQRFKAWFYPCGLLCSAHRKAHKTVKQLLNCKLVSHWFYLAHGWYLWKKKIKDH